MIFNQKWAIDSIPEMVNPEPVQIRNQSTETKPVGR